MPFKSKESRSTRVAKPTKPMTEFQKRLVNDAFAVLLPIARQQLEADQYHRKPISPLTLSGIKAWKFVGNHYSDCEAFNSVTRFVKSDAPLADRAEAIRVMCVNGMGLSRAEAGYGIADADLVAEHLSEEY